MSRTFAIGDMHGCLTAVQTLVSHLDFRPEDKVVVLGDYIDRGPNSRGVIDLLINLRHRTDLVSLRGNHEVMMLAARTSGVDYMIKWLGVGGEATMTSYDARNWSDIPAAHWDFLQSTVAIHETGTHFFVHANVNPALPLAEQTEADLYWKRFQGDEPWHCSGKTMVCGHSPQRNGRPLNLGHAVCIDTFSYGGGWVTCLEVATGRYWQANQRGELREAVLDEP